MGTHSLTRWGFLAAALLVVFEVRAAAIRIDIDTDVLGLNGTNWDLAFDLTDGGNTVANSVTISGFTGATLTGAAGYPMVSGNVTGTLPGNVTLVDTAFSEYLDNANLGTLLSFVLNISDNAPDQGTFPDAFALFLVDPTDPTTTFATSDPTGANALFQYSIGNDNQPELFCPITVPDCITVTPVVVAVPEPGAIALLLAALLALTVMRSRAERPRPVKSPRR